MTPGVNLPPEIGNWLNISKTVEIPTPKPYLILVPCVKEHLMVCSSLSLSLSLSLLLLLK
jgi:hypothetical protein